MPHPNTAIAAFLVALLLIPPLPAQEKPAASDVETDEYLIYGLILDELSTELQAKRFLVGSWTEDFSCDGSSPSGFTVGGCTGMRQQGQTPAQALEEVHLYMPEVPQATVSDFEQKNYRVYQLKEPIPTEAGYEMTGPDRPGGPPKGWKPPDLALYFSRVGFNPAKTDGLVYVASISWIEDGPTGGYYLHAVKKNGKWRVTTFWSSWEGD